MANTLVGWIAGLPEDDLEWAREQLGPMFGEPRRNPVEMPDLPAPLEMDDATWVRLVRYIDDHVADHVPNQRLLVEILDALRRIDDRLVKIHTIVARFQGRYGR